MATNTNPARITGAMWRLWEEAHDAISGVKLGDIWAPKPGYHGTRRDNRSDDYSVGDYPADRRGPADKASAIDLTFPSAQRGNFAEIIRYTKRLDTAARNRDPRLYVAGVPILREVIGTTDGRRPYAYDLQTRRADHNRHPSHLWHIHLSITRQFTADWEALHGLVSILKGESLVAITKTDVRTFMLYDPGDDTGVSNWSWRPDHKTNKTVQTRFAWWLGPEEAHAAKVEAAAARAEVATLRAELARLAPATGTPPPE